MRAGLGVALLLELQDLLQARALRAVGRAACLGLTPRGVDLGRAPLTRGTVIDIARSSFS